MNWYYELWLREAKKEMDNYLYYMDEWCSEMNKREKRRKIREQLYAAIPPRFSWLVLRRLVRHSIKKLVTKEVQ